MIHAWQDLQRPAAECGEVIDARLNGAIIDTVDLTVVPTHCD